MPELPEVESARSSIMKSCLGLRITGLNVIEQGFGPRQGLFDEIVYCDSITKTDMESVLLGKTLQQVHRKGKHLWFELCGTSLAVLFHFGMTGSFVFKDGDIPLYKSFKVSEEWPPKFTKLELNFENDIKLAFCDPRRLARIRIRDDPRSKEPISELGLDPLLDGVDARYLQQELRKYSAPIKSVLLDQEKIYSGIGNYIVDEVLYQAKIHPNSSSKCVAESTPHVETLAQVLRSVISVAVTQNELREDFPADWLFHYRWNKKAGSMPNGNPLIHSLT